MNYSLFVTTHASTKQHRLYQTRCLFVASVVFDTPQPHGPHDVEPYEAERQDGHDDRLLMLQNAALCARMPRSNRRVEPILRMMSETAKQNPGPGKFETRQSII